jgi:CheY-like chemotaxis protein
VLVVDDEESILFAVKDYLEVRGCEVDYAQTLQQALLLLVEAQPYEVVVADLRLSPRQRLGGFQLVEAARQHMPQTHTILLTAYGSPEIEEEARSLGVRAVLPKPIPLRELARVVLELAGEAPQ